MDHRWQARSPNAQLGRGRPLVLCVPTPLSGSPCVMGPCGPSCSPVAPAALVGGGQSRQWISISQARMLSSCEVGRALAARRGAECPLLALGTLK